MHSKRFGIASLVFIVLAFVAQVSFVLQILFPVFFGLSLVVASLAALKGDRFYSSLTVAACLTVLVLFSIGSVVSFHREEHAAWRFTVIVGFLAPVAGLLYATARSRSNFKAYVLPTFVLFFVLAGLQISDLLKVGSDWGWQRGGLETKSVQLPDDVCFSTPDAFCVLALAQKEGLPAQARMRILKKLAALQLEAGNAIEAIELLTEADSTNKSPAAVSSCKRQKKEYEATHYGRARSLVIDAVGQIDASKLSEATETLNQALLHARRLSNGPLLNSDHRRDRTLALISPMQAAAGLEDAAFETVRNIDHVVSRNIALRDIAIVRAHAGNMQGALLNVWWIADQPLDSRPSVRARALGDIALAIGSHSAIPYHQTLNWCALRAVYGIKCDKSCTREVLWSAFF